MRKVIILSLLIISTTLTFGQCPDAPTIKSDQFFCAESAWMLIGENADYLSDLQVFPEQVGWTITWYEDNAGQPGAVIASPQTKLLVENDVYHVTQTDTANCESAATKITVYEKECGCIKDPTFEDQNGNESGRGYEVRQFKGTGQHKTCGQIMNTAAFYPFGTTNGIGPNDDAVFVTPGNDPPYTSAGGFIIGSTPLMRTNVNNPSSSHAFRINRGIESNAVITSLEKEFIAGEVFVFNFALIVQNPNHDFHEQPFAQVRLFDANNNLIQERCLVSDINDCIFEVVGTGGRKALYSDWSCIKMNTFDYMGQPLRAEFIVAYCQPTQHFAYMYLDDLYVGDDGPNICSDPSFGYARVEKIKSVNGDCFIPEPQTAGSCTVTKTASVTGFPLLVCGFYEGPISKGSAPTLQGVKLNIIQNDIVVGSLTNPTAGTQPDSFCFTVNESDVSVTPYGSFTFELEVDYELNCGAAYNFYIEDKGSANVCPRAGCVSEIRICDETGSGISTFDLTTAEVDLFTNRWTSNDMDLSYYESEQDAHDALNAITTPTSFKNTVPGGQTIYIRIDWQLAELTAPCYYLAKLPLAVTTLPELDFPDYYAVCDPIFEINLSAIPTNLPELDRITYKWYFNNVRLATDSNMYKATKTGEYTVVVSNLGCESTHTFTIDLIEFEINLGDDTIICDGSESTISAEIIPGPNTPPIDINEVNFLWNNGDTTQTITVNESGAYTVEVTYKNCTNTKTTQVHIGNPQVFLGEDIIICGSEISNELTAVVVGVPENEVTYLWNTGETSKSILVNDYGNYSVEIDWKGCIASDSIKLIEGVGLEISLGETITKCATDEVTLQVILTEPIVGEVNYTWFLGGGQIEGNGSSIKVTELGLYSVIVDNEGCLSKAEVNVEGYSVNPNCIISQGISPEGSLGQNDNFDLSFLNNRTGIENIQIFNRNGRLVYEKNRYTNEWSGQATNGEKLPTGVYYYVVNLSGQDPVYGRQANGWIYVNRGIN